MPEELGKIKRPAAEEFKKGRKIYFVPLVFRPPEPDEKFQNIINRYWNEAVAHLKALQEKLAPAKKVYHELVAASGEAGLKTIESLNAGSYRIVKDSLEKGAELIAVEDAEIIDEFILELHFGGDPIAHVSLKAIRPAPIHRYRFAASAWEANTVGGRVQRRAKIVGV